MISHSVLWLSHRVGFALARSDACWDLPLYVLLMKLIRWFSVVVYGCPLCVLVLEPLGRGSSTGQCQILLVMGLGYRLGATWSSLVDSCPCWAWICMGGVTLQTKAGANNTGSEGGQQKIQGTPRHVTTCWLPVILSHWNSPGWHACWVRHQLGWVAMQVF